MTEFSLPLIADYNPARCFAWRGGQTVTQAAALAAMQRLANHMPAASEIINRCADRYRFTLAFGAICLSGATNLLPHSDAPGVVEQVRADYPDAGEINDAFVAFVLDDGPRIAASSVPCVAERHRAAVVFTSGTTGQPTAHTKYWGDLVTVAGMYRRRFFGAGGLAHAVATVPAPHMYGLETTVLPALFSGLATESERAFTPWGIAAALARLPAPRILVTTPFHLRACERAGTTMPDIEHVVSATAPLPDDLAAAIETRWQTPVHEIFGSTETGSIASRRTLDGDWQLYDDVALAHDDRRWWVSGPQLPEPIALADDLAALDDRRFRFLGRASNMLKVAGKRLSLEALTHQLLAIEGVRDAVVLPPGSDRQRPRALVVAPEGDVRRIAHQLAQRIDSVFLPRPLRRVDALPRDALGKLRRADAERLFAVDSVNSADLLS